MNHPLKCFVRLKSLRPFIKLRKKREKNKNKSALCVLVICCRSKCVVFFNRHLLQAVTVGLGMNRLFFYHLKDAVIRFLFSVISSYHFIILYNISTIYAFSSLTLYYMYIAVMLKVQQKTAHPIFIFSFFSWKSGQDPGGVQLSFIVFPNTYLPSWCLPFLRNSHTKGYCDKDPTGWMCDRACATQ